MESIHFSFKDSFYYRFLLIFIMLGALISIIITNLPLFIKIILILCLAAYGYYLWSHRISSFNKRSIVGVRYQSQNWKLFFKNLDHSFNQVCHESNNDVIKDVIIEVTLLPNIIITRYLAIISFKEIDSSKLHHLTLLPDHLEKTEWRKLSVYLSRFFAEI